MKTWRERVSEAEQRGTFTAEDRNLSQAWGSCAVGEQRALHPEIMRFGSSSDAFLVTFGLEFPAAIFEDDIHWASRLLDQIEDRVIELKRGV